jgi:hypothetical protein
MFFEVVGRCMLHIDDADDCVSAIKDVERLSAAGVATTIFVRLATRERKRLASKGLWGKIRGLR